MVLGEGRPEEEDLLLFLGAGRKLQGEKRGAENTFIPAAELSCKTGREDICENQESKE